MSGVSKKTNEILKKATRAIKDTASSAGLVDRKEIAIASHKRKSLHHAFWMEQVQKVREIQTTLERNYNESKQDLKTMIEEAVDDFNALPRKVMESGREVPITADIDINTINLDNFKIHVPKQHYYDSRDIGVLEREKKGLKEDIEDLKREHRRRYDALSTLSFEHRHMRIQIDEPSTKQLKSVIQAAFYRREEYHRGPAETSPLLGAQRAV